MGKTRTSFWAAIIMSCTIGAVPMAVRANDTFTGFGSSAFMDSMMDNVRMDSLRRSMMRDGDVPRAPDRSATKSKAAPARPAAAAPAQITTYRASPAVTKRVREQFIAWIGQTSGAEGAKTMRQVMQQHDILALWTQQAKGDGLKPNDLADAFAAYWVQNWQMANGVETTRPEQVMAVRRQVSVSIGAGFTEAQRQELAEVFIYNQFVQGTVWVEAGERKDVALKRKLGEASVARFRNEMKLDLRRLKLTDQGFVAA